MKWLLYCHNNNNAKASTNSCLSKIIVKLIILWWSPVETWQVMTVGSHATMGREVETRNASILKTWMRLNTCNAWSWGVNSTAFDQPTKMTLRYLCKPQQELKLLQSKSNICWYEGCAMSREGICFTSNTLSSICTRQILNWILKLLDNYKAHIK